MYIWSCFIYISLRSERMLGGERGKILMSMQIYTNISNYNDASLRDKKVGQQVKVPQSQK